MTKQVITAQEDMTLTEAMAMLVKHGISCLPVVDADQQLQGIVTEYDIMNSVVSGEAERTRVGDVMHREVLTFTPETDLEAIVNTCLAKRIHRVPICEGGRLVGIVTRRDIIGQLLELYGRT